MKTIFGFLWGVFVASMWWMAATLGGRYPALLAIGLTLGIVASLYTVAALANWLLENWEELS